MRKFVPVVGHDDATHGVKEHLEHGLWSKSCSNNIRDSSGCFDIRSLSNFALLTLGTLVHHVDWRLHLSRFKFNYTPITQIYRLIWIYLFMFNNQYKLINQNKTTPNMLTAWRHREMFRTFLCDRSQRVTNELGEYIPQFNDCQLKQLNEQLRNVSVANLTRFKYILF